MDDSNDPSACAQCGAPWSRQCMHVDDLPVKFMAIGESGKHKGKRFVRVPWAQWVFICQGCHHRWEKPDDVMVGD